MQTIYHLWLSWAFPKTKSALLLSTALLFLLMTDMGTKKGERAKTRRKYPALETMKMVESLQMRVSREEGVLRKAC